MSARLTVARSASVVPGATVSARAIAESIGTVSAKRLGVASMRVLWKRSVTGRENESSTAWAAVSGSRPPIETPASVTPEGTTAGAGVAVVVGVVVVGVVVVGGGGSSANATGTAKAAASTTSERARRFMSGETPEKDPWIVADDSHGPLRCQIGDLVRVVHGPDVHLRPDLPGRPDCPGAHDVDVQCRGVRACRPQELAQPVREEQTSEREAGEDERLRQPGEPVAVFRVGERAREARLRCG